MEVIVEIAGEVKKSDVYKMVKYLRIEDLLIIVGEILSYADRVWIEKNLNREAKLIDGQNINSDYW